MDDVRRTLVFLLRDGDILLALKKRGFGAGLWNGVGGKIEPDETLEQAMVRECQEEIGVTPITFEPVANMNFYGIDKNQPFHLRIHTYLCTGWQGEPAETEEMQPKWYEIAKIPYEKMWDDDKLWLPKILSGHKITGEFYLNPDNKVYKHSLKTVGVL